MQPNDVGRLHLGEDLTLRLRLLHQVFLKQLLLLKYLHRIKLAIIRFADEEDLCKGAATNDLEQFKVVHRDLLARHE